MSKPDRGDRPAGPGAAPGRADLLDAVRAGGLLAAGRPVVVLLSGGRDSVCLLDIAVRIAGAEHVTALHCEYGLRESAADDAASCAVLCEQLGVPLELRHPRRPTGNVQAWARQARYAAGGELAAARGADLAAGHTASDQVETVLYRLAASPGRRALLGMAPREDTLIRPLLGVTRAQTAAHCEARGLTWREDPANADPTYARGRVRHALLPALRSLHPAAEANVLRTLETLRDEAAVLDGVLDAALAEAGNPPAVRALRELPPALARLALQRLADRSVPAGSAPVAVGHRTQEILALPEGGALDAGGGLRARVERGCVSFGASTGPAAPRRDRGAS